VALQEVHAGVQRGETTVLSERLAESGALTAKDVADAARNGDRVAARIIESTGTRLGEAVAILVDVLNPERIVVGGLAMRLGESLLRPARLVMEREALPGSAGICRLVPAKLGESIGDIAAICVAIGL